MSIFPRVAAVLAFVALTTPGARAQGEESAETLARRLQQRYQTITDFRADFTQSTRREVTKTTQRAGGTIAVKKPGRVRMVYSAPEKKEIVHDGAFIWDYVPADRTVIKTPAPPEDEAPTAMLFLGGRGDILRDFVPSRTVSPVDGTIALRLTPRQRDDDYEFLLVVLDPKSLQIRGLVTQSELGGETQITFTNLKENTGIADSTFRFTPPRGVEVIESHAGANDRP